MFADPGISEELMEKIVAFVDREAGRDAPLTADDEAMVHDLLERDTDAMRFADDLRATNSGLDTLLDDVAAIEVPDKLVALIQSHASRDVLVVGQQDSSGSKVDGNGAIAGNAVDRPPMAPGFGYGALAAAASIAFFVSCGALLHLYTSFQDDRARLEMTLAEASTMAETSQRELAAASAEVERYRVVADQSVSESELVSRQLTEKSDLIQRLEVDQAAMQGRYDELVGENKRLSGLARERSTEAAAIDEEREQLMADLSEVREALEAERGETFRARSVLRSQASDLADDLTEKQERLATLSAELADIQKKSAANSSTMTEMQSERQALQNRLASLEVDYRELTTERDGARKAALEAEQKVAALEGNLVIAEKTRQAMARQLSNLEADLEASTSWLVQVAQYHRIYASTARRHLVEVGADEQEHIEAWLETVLERPIPVPDLSEYGVTFQGARLLGVNEKPVAELVYLDADDQPLAFCIIPSTEGAGEPRVSTNRDLNLIDWRDGQYAYAIVGWSGPELLSVLAQTVRPTYDL